MFWITCELPRAAEVTAPSNSPVTHRIRAPLTCLPFNRRGSDRLVPKRCGDIAAFSPTSLRLPWLRTTLGLVAELFTAAAWRQHNQN